MKVAQINSRKEDLSTEDLEVLKSFYIHRYQTLGDLLTFNSPEGGDLMRIVNRLAELGLIKRDARKQLESCTDVIFSITNQGEYAVKDNE